MSTNAEHFVVIPSGDPGLFLCHLANCPHDGRACVPRFDFVNNSLNCLTHQVPRDENPK